MHWEERLQGLVWSIHKVTPRLTRALRLTVFAQILLLGSTSWFGRGKEVIMGKQFPIVVAYIILLAGLDMGHTESIKVTSIDSLYSNWLLEFYPLAKRLIPQIWPGMQLYPVCAFRINGPIWLYNHPNPPKSFRHIKNQLWVGDWKDLRLFGATPVPINGLQTAIIPYGDAPRRKYDFLAELFHEMHHVYQLNEQKQMNFPNVAFIVSYPEIPENVVLMWMENETLLRLVFADNNTNFQRALNLFYSIRKKRREIIGDKYMDYEESEESIEGPAVYCEYKFREFTKEPIEPQGLFHISQWGKFFSPLMKREYSRDNLRELKLMTGLCQCLILSHKKPDWRGNYYGAGLPLREFLFENLPAQQVEVSIDSNDLNLAKYFIDLEKQTRKRKFTDFMNQEGIRVNISFLSTPECRGIDPMNMEAIDDTTIMHNTMLKLGKDGYSLSFTTGGICTTIGEDIWTVKSALFFVKARKQLLAKNGYIYLDLPGQKIEWAGKILKETNRRIEIELK